MPDLPRASLGVFPTRSHVEDWSSIHIEACKNTAHRHRISQNSRLTSSHSTRPENGDAKLTSYQSQPQYQRHQDVSALA